MHLRQPDVDALLFSPFTNDHTRLEIVKIEGQNLKPPARDSKLKRRLKVRERCSTARFALLGLCAVSATVYAGRPLTVDDADVNVKGAGHVEVWAAHELTESGVSRTLTVAPAFAPLEGVELTAMLTRDQGNKTSLTSAQVKWRITATDESGCNFGATLARARSSENTNPSATNFNALMSCNRSALGSLHLNLGGVNRSGERASRTWGVAVERLIGGVNLHVEQFGEERAKPTSQAGASIALTKRLQLDGTIGRSGSNKILSAGFKVGF